MPRRKAQHPNPDPLAAAKAEIVRAITRWRRHHGPRPTIRAACECGKPEERAIPECRSAVPDYRLVDAMRIRMDDRIYGSLLRRRVGCMLLDGAGKPVLAVSFGLMSAGKREVLETLRIPYVEVSPGEVLAEPARWIAHGRAPWRCRACRRARPGA